MRLTPRQKELLADLGVEPKPEEKWVEFDPPYPDATVSSLYRAGLIEVKVEPGCSAVLIRFTQAGRELFEKGKKRFAQGSLHDTSDK